MTLPSGQISVNNINTEIGYPATYSSDLNFLNGFIIPSQRPSSPNMAPFQGLSYFQNNSNGNCDNSNAAGTNCNTGDATHQCHACTNCSPINCANCDTQPWLQSGNCNTACTYNCDTPNNCYTNNCNCLCNCCCVVATALTKDGKWTMEDLESLEKWAVDKLDTNKIGETFHRGYHIIGAKVFIPLLKQKKSPLISKYIDWTFSNGANMLSGKPYKKLSIVNSIPWILSMFIVGLFVNKRYATRTWMSLYIKNRKEQKLAAEMYLRGY